MQAGTSPSACSHEYTLFIKQEASPGAGQSLPATGKASAKSRSASPPPPASSSARSRQCAAFPLHAPCMQAVHPCFDMDASAMLLQTCPMVTTRPTLQKAA